MPLSHHLFFAFVAASAILAERANVALKRNDRLSSQRLTAALVINTFAMCKSSPKFGSVLGETICNAVCAGFAWLTILSVFRELESQQTQERTVTEYGDEDLGISSLDWSPSKITSAMPMDTSDTQLQACRQDGTTEVKIRAGMPELCKQILKGEELSGDLVRRNAVMNTLTKFQARAAPNKRLVEAFLIDNCFSTEDANECKEFHNKAEARLDLGERKNRDGEIEQSKWDELAHAAKAVAGAELQRAFAGRVEIFSVIQMLTLKVALQCLCDVDIHIDDPEHDDHIRRLAKEINAQWLRSKGEYDAGVKPVWAFEKQTELLWHVQAIFPDWDIADRKGNPFNMILPGYETLWRVALRCFLEIQARGHADAEIWSATLKHFVSADSPICVASFRDRGADGKQSSAEMIAKEALRLYPPTRRIYRDFKDESGLVYHMAADVEASQREEETWGVDALLFKPSRWSNVRPDFERENFMAFGAKPFTCPAKGRVSAAEKLPFGPTMVAFIVGILLVKTEDDELKWRVVGEVQAGDIPLSTAREAYSDVLLQSAC